MVSKVWIDEDEPPSGGWGAHTHRPYKDFDTEEEANEYIVPKTVVEVSCEVYDHAEGYTDYEYDMDHPCS